MRTGVTLLDQSASRSTTPDDLAISACFEGFVAQILPGSTPGSRTIVRADNPFGGKPELLRAELHMEARQPRGGMLLATSVCTVTRTAKVVTLSTRWLHPERLAGLTVSDIAFSTVRR